MAEGDPKAFHRTRGFRIAFGIGAPVLALGGAAFLYLYDPTRSNLFPCLVLKVTGYYCTGCGTTRMLHSLLHLHVFQAFDFNPFFFLILPLIAYVLLSGYLQLVTGRRVLPAVPMPGWLGMIVGIMLVAFTILRNIPIPPFSFLAP